MQPSDTHPTFPSTPIFPLSRASPPFSAHSRPKATVVLKSPSAQSSNSRPQFSPRPWRAPQPYGIRLPQLSTPSPRCPSSPPLFALYSVPCPWLSPCI